MNCPRCQAENREGLRFCEDCGARLAAICPSCGLEVTAGKRFCGSCGASLVRAAQAEARFASPQAYTPRHLAERIVSSKASLEGERKQVTVLFADMKGSMELVADRDPEEARTILDPALELMMEAVHRYEGTVNQVMGDGIMALFGAPIAHEDHAVRACYAALRMQEAAKRYAEGMLRSHGVSVEIRAGVNSGEVVVRSISSDLRMDYTAVGQMTHLAARMEQLASPGTILITSSTLRLAEGFVQTKRLGPVPVKGVSEPVEVYEIVGAGAVRRRLEAAAIRGLTRFIGRGAELELLHKALDRAERGQGQVVAVVGEPGVGKSRLFFEFTRPLRHRGWLVVEAGAVSYGKATPYLPMIELLKAYFHIEPRDPPRRVREQVTGKLLTLDRALESALLPLLALLDVPVEDAEWRALDPPQRRHRTLEACRQLLLRESHAQPLLLVFEDLQWIDGETQALLDRLVQSLPGARLLLLVNCRPEYRPPWSASAHTTQARIEPLPPENAEELVDTLFGSDPGLGPLKRLLVTRTEGNPFFIEESVRTLVETGVLVGAPGAYRVARPLAGIGVPTTVQAMLAARIDRLAVEHKELLQTAAVVGKDVPFALLGEIAELGETELRAALDQLQASEFLYAARLFPEVEYTFKHALTHEVAYGSILQERRRALHARIAGAIETLYAEHPAEHLEALAHHAMRGEVWEKAVTYLRQAGAKALARSANQDALACFEQALAALRHLRERRETSEQGVDLRLLVGNSLWWRGELERILPFIKEAESLAERLDDQLRLGRISSFMANCRWQMGEQQHAIAAGLRAREIAGRLGDARLGLLSTLALGQIHVALGDYRAAMELLGSVTASLRHEHVDRRLGLIYLPAVLSHGFLARCLAEVGDFEAAAAAADEALRVAETADHPASLIHAHFQAGHVRLARGELARADTMLSRCLGLCRTWDNFEHLRYVLATLGYTRVLAGAVAGGLALLEEAAEEDAARGRRFWRSIRAAWRAEGYLAAHRVDDAARLARQALEMARCDNERASEAAVLRLLGAIAAGGGRPDVPESEAHYREAIGLARELGVRPLVAHGELGLGVLYAGLGEERLAHEHIGAATVLYRDMGMAFWLRKAQSAMTGTT
jgi:class 3 adenylate cyclase/tetratricopeptide (TPR) repeat protein